MCFSPHRNMLLCSSVWMPPLCLKKSYATPNPFHFSGIVLDLLCKYSTLIFLSQLFILVLWLFVLAGIEWSFFFSWNIVTDFSVAFLSLSSSTITEYFMLVCDTVASPVSACSPSAPEEVLWHSAPSRHKRCSCSRCLTPWRRRRRTMTTTTVHPATRTTTRITATIIYTRW